ncbi:hypothetical protein [Paracidovorax sp. MALMAid1276]|uniref:hypothetical protein n=1 Tax=Paracidovorax sp. MALMAid1276 TaxID=3411631 RepID=UPI003B9DC2A7
MTLVPSSLGTLFGPRVVFKGLGAKSPRADVHAVQRRDDQLGVVPAFVRVVAGV